MKTKLWKFLPSIVILILVVLLLVLNLTTGDKYNLAIAIAFGVVGLMGIVIAIIGYENE